jgi:hypothetical protein
LSILVGELPAQCRPTRISGRNPRRSLPKINATSQKAASGADKSRLRAVGKPNEIILA